MPTFRAGACVAAALTLAACSGAQRRANRADGVSVKVDERVDGKPEVAGGADEAWTRELIAAGYSVAQGAAAMRLDVSAEANRVDAPPEFQGFTGYRARVSARLLRGADVLAAASSDAGGLDVDPRLAAAKAVQTAVRAAAEKLIAQARTTAPGAPDETLDYSDGKGSLTAPGGIDSRPKMLRRIGALCSTKNIALKAGQESVEGGVYRVDKESLSSGSFRIDFACLY